jgi:hypothetical protein
MITSGPSRSGPRPVMLARRRTAPDPAPACTDAPAVLAHPVIPSHRVILARDCYAVPLGWPPVAVRITTSVALPPTITPGGLVLWV